MALAAAALAPAACGTDGEPRAGATGVPASTAAATAEAPTTSSATAEAPATSPPVTSASIDPSPTSAPSTTSADATPAVDTGPPRCGEVTGRTTRTTFSSQVFAPSAKPVQPFLVHTPPCYDVEARRYPVLYLLHGAQTDETQWADVGVLAAADRLVAAGEIPPLIIVLPDALHAMGDYDGTTPPLDWFVLYELQPRVEQGYRTRNDPAHRAIGGISRGGEWALLIAARHPEVFGAVGGHSPAVGVPTNPGPQLATMLAGKPVRVWLDVGSSDSLVSPVTDLDRSLTARGITHDLQVGAGGHDRSYWGAHVDDYLRWYTAPWKDR